MTPFAVNRAMSRARFLELLRGALLEMKVEQSAAQTAGYNRLPRFLPTLGNVLALDHMHSCPRKTGGSPGRHEFP